MGERADYRFVGEALASQGIVAVIADYRLSPEVRYPVFVQDSVVNPVRSTMAMGEKLKNSGVRVEFDLLDSVGHVTLVAAMASVLRGRAPVLERVAAFVKSTP